MIDGRYKEIDDRCCEGHDVHRIVVCEASTTQSLVDDNQRRSRSRTGVPHSKASEYHVVLTVYWWLLTLKICAKSRGTEITLIFFYGTDSARWKVTR